MSANESVQTLQCEHATDTADARRPAEPLKHARYHERGIAWS